MARGEGIKKIYGRYDMIGETREEQGKRGREGEGISLAALGKFAVDVQSSTKQFLYHIIQMMMMRIIIIAIIVINSIIIIDVKFCMKS